MALSFTWLPTSHMMQTFTYTNTLRQRADTRVDNSLTPPQCVASESWMACYCERHAAIVSSVQVGSNSKHHQSSVSSVCPPHMWGSVKLNNAEGWNSGREFLSWWVWKRCDNASKNNLIILAFLKCLGRWPLTSLWMRCKIVENRLLSRTAADIYYIILYYWLPN